MKPVHKNIPRKRILRGIEDCLNRAKQWSSGGNYEWAYKYNCQAEVLIELLEADDCGSHGGFDKERGQEHPTGDTNSRLKARYKWLKALESV